MLNKTIKYYNSHATEFFEGTIHADMSFCQNKFLSYLKSGAVILDAGCGSGRDTKEFIEQGFRAKAFDASEELCQLASKLIGETVEVLRFEEIEYDSEFDGIWANASLLHIEKKELPKVFRRLYRALKDGGIIYSSFKYGDSEGEVNERFFSSFTEKSAVELFESEGLFDVLECFVTGDVRIGRENEKWINVISRKIQKL